MKLRLILATISLSLLPLLTSGVIEAQKTRTQSRSATFLKQPFDVEGRKLNPNFKGHNIVEIQTALRPRLLARRKREFESTEEYWKRVELLDGKPYLGSLRLNSRLAFILGSESVRREYDADSGVLTVVVKLSGVVEGDNWNTDSYAAVIQKNDGPTSTYLGQNAYGASTTVVKTQQFFRTVAFVNHSQIGIRGSVSSASLACEIPLDPATARKLKDRLKVVLVSRLSRPYMTSGVIERRPTLSYPSANEAFHTNLVAELMEIWIYDPLTGTVYFKSDFETIEEEVDEEIEDGNSIQWKRQ